MRGSNREPGPCIAGWHGGTGERYEHFLRDILGVRVEAQDPARYADDRWIVATEYRLQLRVHHQFPCVACHYRLPWVTDGRHSGRFGGESMDPH
jgi:hypothetical protein